VTPLRRFFLTLFCVGVAACASSKPQDTEAQSGTSMDFPGGEIGKSDAFGRALIGLADPYPADLTLDFRGLRLQRDMEMRRALGWAVAARVLAPVPLYGLADAQPDKPIEIDGGMPTVPRWQTWYGVDDFRRVFQRLYGELGAERRDIGEPFTFEEIDAALLWNAAAVDRSSRWPLDRFLRHVERLGICPVDQDAASCARSLQSNFSGGAAGNARITYSPGTITHLLKNYGAQLACLDALDALSIDHVPVEEFTNFTACLDAEFPRDAALIKAQWVRADFGRGVPVYDTDADALERIIGDGQSAHWAGGDRTAQPGPDEIFTVRLRNGDLYRLAGLHVMTKELRHWVWVTLWWSDTPNKDFGEDRPAAFKTNLDSVWSHYKMAVVTHYRERDPDPGQSFDEYPSLQAALRVKHGDSTWASNPYIEHGRGNARTNCIGCHQHGGSTVAYDRDDDGALDPLVPEDIIADGYRFPLNGRVQIRRTFPMDYLWSTQRVDNLRQVMLTEVSHFERVDRDPISVRIGLLLETAGLAESGREIFSNQCTSCHGVDGLGGAVGPSLADRVPTLDEKSLLEVLLKGRNSMPAWPHLADQELADLHTFLRSAFDADF